MSNYFNTHGIPSMFLTGKSPDEVRNDAKNKLISGKVRFIFVVDIYNFKIIDFDVFITFIVAVNVEIYIISGLFLNLVHTQN